MEQQKLTKDFQHNLERFRVVQTLSAQKSRDYVARAKTMSPHLEEL
jgi:syntaxin 7